MYAGFKEEGDACGVCGCDGKLEFVRRGDCSCHIAPPCENCVNRRLTCLACGWTDETEPESAILNLGDGLGLVVYKPRQLDNTKIDYVQKLHSSCSMLVEGVYPGGTSPSDVEAVVKGTFGGRFEQFGDGHFRYIAYTD